MATIRPFEPSDDEYAKIVALVRAVWPEREPSVVQMRHEDATRDPSFLFERIVLDENGEIPAYGLLLESPWAYVPGHYEVTINVHPDRRREGIATRLYRWMLDRLADRDPAPIKLQSYTHEDQPGALAMLEKYGFKEVMRGPVSTLDIAAFDPAPFAATDRRVRESGIEIVTLTELAGRDPDWKRKIYDLYWELEQDIPSPDPPTQLPFDSWSKQVFDSPGFLAEAHFVALDGERWVGVSSLGRAVGSTKTLYVWLTGVSRSHRRRGLATALKLRTIEFARDFGAEKIRTDNEENNPMYQLNLALGFEPQPAWVLFEKVLEEDA